VPTQLREHPLADDRTLSGVVKDVHLPEPQENLARQQLRIERCHRLGAHITTVVNDNNSVDPRRGWWGELTAFANVSLGESQILLSGPGTSGSRPMPTGEQQEPGGWSRVVLKIADLPGFIAQLKKAGLRFRNEMEAGPGGRQIQIEDPDGNPVELFEPARLD
jgi:hypothetical protein